ncbi:MAG: SUF system Fe-S cluster assembly regulator [Acidobacteria bacterium]|nr:SUF system Fe-S cluster assembly regulator [Acidobacteriota bacterium]
MIRMTRLTDYAMVLLTVCARHPERPLHNTRDLAAEAHLPLPTVGKILKLLAKEGLLVSHRGVRGGYVLARQPDKITVAEILEALEGPVAITDCSSHEEAQCELETNCPVASNWQKINQVVLNALGGITLSELARPLGERLVTLGPWRGGTSPSAAPAMEKAAP